MKLSLPASKKKRTLALTINLLPRDPFYDSAFGKSTKWALSVGRYIIIFTEIVVILSFLSRFQLDRQVTDLNTKIVQQTSIIESYGDLENEIRLTQKKIETYKQFRNNNQIDSIFTLLTSITPSEIQYLDLSITATTVQIKGRTQSTQALTNFISNLQQTREFSSVVVDNIINKDAKTPGFDFSIQAKIAKTESTTQSSP
jgi:Tfp pilus assembly protein PilN